MKDKVKMERLRHYYNTRIYSKPLPAFDSLTEDQINQIQGTYGFAVYNLGMELNNAKSLVYRKLGLVKK
jgi:hypothetical protein